MSLVPYNTHYCLYFIYKCETRVLVIRAVNLERETSNPNRYVYLKTIDVLMYL